MTERFIWTLGGSRLSLPVRSPDELPSVQLIGHSLSQINRWTGWTRYPYPVAQHAVIVSYLVPCAPFAALHHDDHEVQTGDISTPVKRYLASPGLRALARAFDDANEARLGIELTDDERHQQKLADLLASYDEAVWLVNVPQSERNTWFDVAALENHGGSWRVGAWLRQLGIWNQRSREKRIPQEAFRLSRRQVALLLRHLWATDGTIYTLKKSGRSWVQVAFTTASRGLADDVAALLLRLAIVARVVRLPKKSGASGDVFAVQITGGRDQKAFLREVGGDGHRAEQVRAALGALGARSRENTNVDTLPLETWQAVRESMKRNGITQRAMAKARGTEYGGASHFKFAPSRSVVANYATILGDNNLALAARSDLFWDSVASVTPVGSDDVYDLTVPGTASWLADGVVSHNSGNVEQDAHAILFLYRDDYYFKDSEDRGLVEILVGKDRDGGSGWIKMKFTGEYTRFDSLASEPDEFHGDFDERAA